tara:strand:- start:4040 stop:4732 length:693 start_codon:yes stop_codon:yes gene_type:complete
MATVTFTPLMLRGAGTRGVPLIPKSGGAFEYTAIDNNFSMAFDGVASSFNAGLFNELDNGDLSVCIWINTPNTRTVTDYVFGNDGATVRSGFDIEINRYGRLRTNRQTRTLRADTGFNTVGLTTNTWHHIAFAYEESTNTIKQYFDGQLTETLIGDTRNSGASINLHIGSFNGTGNHFLGNLDEAAIFNVKLSDETIKAIYDTTENNPGKVADLSETPEGAPVAWYRMGD